MINKPALTELMEHVDSKYTLAVVAAKRARFIIDSAPDIIIDKRINPVSMALQEVADGGLSWESISAHQTNSDDNIAEEEE